MNRSQMEVLIQLFLVLSGFPKFTQLSPCPARPAGCTVAFIVNQSVRVFPGTEIDWSIQGIDPAVTGFSCGSDAVKGVSTHGNTHQDVIRMGQSKKMAWFVFRKFFAAPAEYFSQIIFQKSTTKAIAVKVHGAKFSGCGPPEVFPSSPLKHSIE